MAHHCHCHSNCCKYKDVQEVCCLLQRYHSLLRAKHSRLVRKTFLENLKSAVKRAVAETTVNERDASSSEDEESNQEDSSEEDSNEEDSNKEESAAKGERAGDESSSDQESGEGSIDEVQEQEELMTVEQAELMEQYRNDLFRQF